MESFKFDIGLILLGFFVALFSVGIGIGGGTLLVSMLISVFGFEFKKAASTSLSTIIPISFIGAVSHFIFSPEIPYLGHYYIFIPACVLGAILGGKIVQKRQNRLLKVAFSLFLIIISLRMLKIFDFPSLIYSALYGTAVTNEWLLIVTTGIFIGIIAVFLGIGCGLIIVPFYVIAINIDIHQAITLSLTTMFFLTLSATIIHNKLKTLDMTPVKSLFIPALTGAVVGAMISSHIPSLMLKKLFGILLFIIACTYIVHEISVHLKVTGLIKNYRKEIK